jgi:hypothetical protein
MHNKNNHGCKNDCYRLLVVKILTSSKQNIILKVLGVKVNYLVDISTNCISSNLWSDCQSLQIGPSEATW